MTRELERNIGRDRARVGHRSTNLLDLRRHGLLAQRDPTSQTEHRRVVVLYELKAPLNDRCEFAVDRQYMAPRIACRLRPLMSIRAIVVPALTPSFLPPH